MSELTLKEFLLYNGPCINCDTKIHYNIRSMGKSSKAFSSKKISSDINYADDTIICSLKIRYRNKLELKIDCQNNNFTSTNSKELIKHLENNNIYVESHCPFCMTYVESQHFIFDHINNIIMPIKILYEKITLNDKINDLTYHINSSVASNETIVDVISYEGKDLIFNSYEIKFPLMLSGRFKNKYFFIKRIKQMMAFL